MVNTPGAHLKQKYYRICLFVQILDVGGFCMLKQHTNTATFNLVRTFLSFEGFHQHEMVSFNYHDFNLMKRKNIAISC